MKYTIIVDKSFNLTPQEIKQHDIEVINLHTYINDLEVDIDISEEEFYKELYTNENAKVKTAAPAPAAIKNKIDQAKLKSEHVIIMTISSQMSSTYQSAKLIASEYENVHVFDTKGVFAKNKILFDFFCANVDTKLDIKSVLKQAKEIRDQTKILFVVSDLKYLQQNGRIGKAAGFIGSALKIKPILEVDKNGIVNTISKVRTSKKAVEKIVAEIKLGTNVEEVYIATLDDQPLFDQFVDTIKKELPNTKLNFSQKMPPTISVHSGPKVFIIAFLDKNNTIYES